MKKTAFLLITLIVLSLSLNGLGPVSSNTEKKVSWWEVQSIDTMKYSRDLAGQFKENDGLDETIKLQVENIADVGATHVAVGTPYDSEFLPFLKKWVGAARENGLNVWFRGNFSGWEGWFGYSAITPESHIQKTKAFIEENAYLFEDGDIFTACPECENGALEDPRRTGNKESYTEFLLEESEVVSTSFERIGKKVTTNFNSMNLDVAKLLMDKETTEKLGGVVVVDHYVRSPERLAFDIEEIAERSGGMVVLGEFGAPIPDIHGDLTEEEQAEWVKVALAQISQSPNLAGINYWVSVGGSTAIWNDDGSEREAVSVIRNYYIPNILEGRVRSPIGVPIRGAIATIGNKVSVSDGRGNFAIAHVPGSSEKLTIIAQGYKAREIDIGNESKDLSKITLESSREGLLLKLVNFLKTIFGI